jgi:hypothetical protein
MLSRYQIEPVAVIGLLALHVLLFAGGFYFTLRNPHSLAWIGAFSAVLSLFNFHRRFSRSAD